MVLKNSLARDFITRAIFGFAATALPGVCSGDLLQAPQSAAATKRESEKKENLMVYQ
jgi:hypothetical protein